MFQFSGFTSIWLCIHHTVLEYCSSGFPHSEIHESMDICSSSWLIAACHVLLRLLMPRHSSYALISLTLSRKSWFEGQPLSISIFVRHSNIKTISRSPWVLLNYMSKSCKVLDTNVFFNTFSYPFSIWKNLYFFLLLLCIQFSIYTQTSVDVWKVNSVKRLRDKSSDLIDQ